jgi:Lecithin:cholesterol acyltransferase
VPLQRVAVLVPGILGSILRHIWSDDLLKNYKALLNNPGLLSWKGIKAKPQFMSVVRVGYFYKMPLWDGIFQNVSLPADFVPPPNIIEFGYDWRQSNLDSAADLGSELSQLLGSPVSDPPPQGEQRRLTFIMHSMGGLVVPIAIAKRFIDINWVDRLVHIGSPLSGAQSAFRTIFGRDEILPLLSVLLNVRHLKNRDRFLNFLQQCVRTCPSVYELLPHRQIPYLHYSTVQRTNPLNESHLEPQFRRYAMDAHALLDQARTTLMQANTLSFTIYTHFHPSLKTDIEFRVEPQQPGYQIIEVTGMTSQGDGTVPAESARGDNMLDRSSPVYGSRHAMMCRDADVAAVVQSIL